MKGNDTGELYRLEKLLGVEVFRSDKNFGFYASGRKRIKRIKRN
jgi:hypothetical protein